MDMRCPGLDGVDSEEDRSARYICIDPTRLAQLVIATLVDDDGRRCFVRVDAERFWPTHLGWKRPTPRVIINAVDDIAKYGTIPEALFPVLWQVCTATRSRSKTVSLVVANSNGVRITANV